MKRSNEPSALWCLLGRAPGWGQLQAAQAVLTQTSPQTERRAKLAPWQDGIPVLHGRALSGNSSVQVLMRPTALEAVTIPALIGQGDTL